MDCPRRSGPTKDRSTGPGPNRPRARVQVAHGTPHLMDQLLDFEEEQLVEGTVCTAVSESAGTFCHDAQSVSDIAVGVGAVGVGVRARRRLQQRSTVAA